MAHAMVGCRQRSENVVLRRSDALALGLNGCVTSEQTFGSHPYRELHDDRETSLKRGLLGEFERDDLSF